MKVHWTMKGALTAVSAMLLLASSAVPAKSISSQVEQIAETAYLYGLQQVIYSGQRYTYTQDSDKDNQSYVGTNRFFNVRKKITPDFPVVTPNATTLYGTGFLDMQKEPVIIEMPAITDRYFSLRIMDQYGLDPWQREPPLLVVFRLWHSGAPAAIALPGQ